MRLSDLINRAKEKRLRKDPGLTERERHVVDVVFKQHPPERLDSMKVEELVGEASSPVPEYDEFKEVVRKIDEADNTRR